MKTLLLPVALILGCCLNVAAQKLPAIQTVAVKAPAKIKIDGKLSEWGGMQAYSRAINASYTIANDADNLYLLIQASEEQAVKKIIGGKITFIILRGVKDSAAITFPMLSTESKNRISMPYVSREKKYPPTDPKRADSLRLVLNNTVANKCKEIDLKGMQGLADSAISVYNEEGIKAALNFDERFALNYELAIPLKYLGLGAKADISYEIRFDHINFLDMTKIVRLANGERVTVISSPRAITVGSNSEEMNSDTYLKGKYILSR